MLLFLLTFRIRLYFNKWRATFLQILTSGLIRSTAEKRPQKGGCGVSATYHIGMIAPGSMLYSNPSKHIDGIVKIPQNSANKFNPSPTNEQASLGDWGLNVTLELGGYAMVLGDTDFHTLAWPNFTLTLAWAPFTSPNYARAAKINRATVVKCTFHDATYDADILFVNNSHAAAARVVEYRDVVTSFWEKEGFFSCPSALHLGSSLLGANPGRFRERRWDSEHADWVITLLISHVGVREPQRRAQCPADGDGQVRTATLGVQEIVLYFEVEPEEVRSCPRGVNTIMDTDNPLPERLSRTQIRGGHEIPTNSERPTQESAKEAMLERQPKSRRSAQHTQVRHDLHQNVPLLVHAFKVTSVVVLRECYRKKWRKSSGCRRDDRYIWEMDRKLQRNRALLSVVCARLFTNAFGFNTDRARAACDKKTRMRRRLHYGGREEFREVGRWWAIPYRRDRVAASCQGGGDVSA
ncbi:hypothetical protein BDZ89DRAFT_1053081 [Hymenopellis radicata]|nr:hypothetical protein BDZ89DRAFT_1053081 [Hymenopellis radicata]